MAFNWNYTFKYRGKLNDKPDWLMSPADIAQVDFDLERLNPQTLFGRLGAAVASALLPILLWLSREFAPLLRVRGLQFITRHADVVWALENSDKLRVHFNPEVREFAGGETTFMLALDGEAHKCQRARIGAWFTDDINRQYADLTSKFATQLLDASGGNIDIMKDYFTRVSAEVGIALLGLDVDDADAFADWTIAMSNANFADFQGDPVARELGSYGAWRERGVVDLAIAHARENSEKARGLLAYLIKSDVLGADSDAIRSVIFGVSVALAPTITVGAGNMMAYLRSHPDALAQCVAAANADDLGRLRTLLLEAGRLAPALDPGQFRYAPEDVELPPGVFGRRRTIRAGSTVLVATASALRDRRVFDRPGQFLPDRDNKLGKAWMMFGHGPHVCLGAELAIQQLTRLFHELLRRPDLVFAEKKKGVLKRVGPFPRELWMTFTVEDRPRGQSQIICQIRVPRGDPAKATHIREAVQRLGNPASDAVAQALTKTGRIHFMSMTVIDDPDPTGTSHSLILELRADGDERQALVHLALALGQELLPIMESCGFDSKSQSLADFLLGQRLPVTTWPWGATGLHYNGSEEFSVDTKHRQAALAAFASDAYDFYLKATAGQSTRPIAAVQFVRSLILGTEFEIVRGREGLRKSLPPSDALEKLKQRGKAFDGMLMIPSRQRPGFVDWRDKSDWDKVSDYLGSHVARPALWTVLLGLIVAGGLAWASLLPSMPWSSTMALGFFGSFLVAVATAVGILLISIAITTFLFVRKLRRLELADRPDNRDPDPDNLRAIAARENAPGYQQNHITAISDTKVGWFRRISLSLAMWGIGVLVSYWFRTGFIFTMGTIHFASWVRLPKSGKLVFLSNYDGSWDSYLEDFITKVPSGQTAAWTHAIGFPRTRLLIGEGVRDADRFKRWVRRQQRPTDFWYSRQPGLTLDRIRINALIHDGLARAHSDTAARQWSCNFGSAQATDTLLEAQEIQTIVFRALPGRASGAILLLQLPAEAAARKALLDALLSGDSAQGFPTINFGEMQRGGDDHDSVAFIGFSASGLLHCGLQGDAERCDLPGFPFAFTDGMRRRARIVGDPEDGSTLAWHDRDAGGAPVHAVLQFLANAPEMRDRHVEAFETRLQQLGGRVVEKINTDVPDAARPQRDYFKFRDGISQPAIRGSIQQRRALERDLMEPGEFIFGYRGNQGNIAPSPQVPIETDRDDLLPDITVEPASRFPAARKLQSQSSAFRDFGRNGSFMVIRQLQQHVEKFETFTNQQADKLKHEFPLLAARVGREIDGDWIAAKMIGRWQDGKPLSVTLKGTRNDPAGSPGNDPQPFREPPLDREDNDFSFGKTDPRGLACPLGAHIRRVNPRDSLLPEDPEGLMVSNRHRILRRGRSYARTVNGKTEKGLMFIGICSDIERQFEFIQQRWISGSSFHGLENETDPIAGPQNDQGRFTIPTVSGPLRIDGLTNFIQTRGGGYFFLPSRSALLYLARLQTRQDAKAVAGKLA